MSDTLLRVASWPGKTKAHNPFLNIFLGGLEDAGCTVDSLASLADLERVAATGPDILLIHWAERVFAEAKSRWQVLGNIRRLFRAIDRRPAGTRVIWLAHNLEPHDARRFQKLVWPRYMAGLSRRIDGVITLAPGTVPVVQAALPALAGKPAAGLWHPAYPDAALAPEARAHARAALGLAEGDCLLGYCGQIRPYKGVSDLLTRFLETQDQSLRLLLAGRPQDNRPGAADFIGDLKAKAASDPRVILQLGDLSEAEFRSAQGVCDVIVAPFRRYLHSGSLVHALSAGRPVLTPRTPFAESYQDLLGTDWVRLYDGVLTAGHLTRTETDPARMPDLTPLSQANVGAAARAFFESVTRR